MATLTSESSNGRVGQEINGTPGDDVIHGTNGDDTIRDFEGVDIIYARNGDDRVITNSDRGDIGDKVYGGNGDDDISTGSGSDYVDGGKGDDDISTGDGADIVHAGSGNDRIVAYSSFDSDADTVFGGKGDDEILVGRGADTVNGGAGDDTIVLNTPLPLVPYLLPDGADTVLFEYASSGRGFGHDTLSEVQEEDVLVILDKSGKTESVDDLADQTRLVDVGENAYRIEWLKGDQSITLNLDVTAANFEARPETVDWDNFTTLQELAEVVNFQFDYAFA